MIKLNRHQEQSMHASDDHSTEYTSVHLKRCDHGKCRAIIAEHTVGAAREPWRTMDKDFAQGCCSGSLDGRRGKRAPDSSKNRPQ